MGGLESSTTSTSEGGGTSSSSDINNKNKNNNNNNSNETDVLLNVYDLTPLNNYVSWFGFGIFHSGVEGNITISANLFVYVSLLLHLLLNFLFNLRDYQIYFFLFNSFNSILPIIVSIQYDF